MASYVNLPTLHIDFLWMQKRSFKTQGGGIDGGRNGLGESITIGLTGGPHVVGGYDCFIHEPEQHAYFNLIGARMNDSHRFMNVPIWTDWAGPFPGQTPMIGGIPHSDGSLFSDGSGYSQPTVFAAFAQSAALNAGEIVVNVFGASRNIRHSEWMSTHNSVKGHRAFRNWEVSDPIEGISATVDGKLYTGGKRYTMAITPPLRQAAIAGQRIELARPRCVMKFPVGFTVADEIDPGMNSMPSLQFVEAF